MMLLAALLLAGAARAEVVVHERAIASTTGGYLGNRTEGRWVSPKGAYQWSARVDSFRYSDAFSGWAHEYSAGVRRELAHVSLGLRLGTRPPDAQRTAYHLVGADVGLTFYGLELGPSRPELAAAVWEEEGAPPAAESFDRTWVTRFTTRYANTNHHMERPAGIFVLVQNAWQFRIEETWRERVGLALETGFDRYNRTVDAATPRPYEYNLEYPGNSFALRTWPNNYTGADLWVRHGAWRPWIGGTRLNILGNRATALWGIGLRHEGERLALGLSYQHRRLRGVETREGFAVDASYRW